MRKKFFIPLIVAAGVLVVGTAPTLSDYKKVEADTLTTYIEMNKDAFTVPSDAEAAGVFEPSTATYWPTYAGYHDEDGDSFNYSFFALDTFFCGERKEGQTIDLTLNSWIQKTQYIYFTWGGAKNDGEDVRLVFHYGDYSSQMLNDTSMGNPMLLRYFKIPDEQYALLNKETGFNMYIELIDNRTGNYGFHNFGYLHVNQTKEQVGDAMRFYINNLVRRYNDSNDVDTRRSQIRIRKEILNHYFGNSYLRDVFYASSSNIDEDFENNNDFLNHWYFDYNYFNGANWDLHFDRAIGTDSVRPADTHMPFNKTGNGFFRGWFENDSLGGFVNGDGSRYRFVSRPFVLSGTGLVSIKMAGTASLHVIDPATRQDLAWADILTFNTGGSWDDLSVSDFNTVTMIRHVVNLEAYLGKTIQLAIADVGTGGWSALYADELITDYESNPGFKIDAFNHNESNVFKTDKYINSTIYNSDGNSTGLKYVVESDMNKANNNEIINHQDNSPAKDAYNYLNDTYYSNRNNNEQRLNVLNAYYSLSSDAKSIVNASSNVLGVGETPVTVGEKIATLLGEDSVYTISFNANGGEGSIASLDLVEHTLINLPNCSFTAPAGKKFKEWNTSEDGTGTSKAEGNEIEVLEDVTWYAIWVDTAKTKVEAIDTYSTLSYSCNNDGGDFVYSNVKIRFGGYVTKALWDELNSDSEILSYGVMVSLEENESQGFIGSRTFESAYASALAEAEGNVDNAINSLCSGGKIKNFSEDVAEMPYLYEAALSENFDEDTYTWNIAQKVTSPSSLTRVYVAVAYIRTADGIVFLNESRASAKSIAQDMIDSPEYDEDSFEGSLKYLADLA